MMWLVTRLLERVVWAALPTCAARRLQVGRRSALRDLGHVEVHDATRRRVAVQRVGIGRGVVADDVERERTVRDARVVERGEVDEGRRGTRALRQRLRRRPDDLAIRI